MEYINRTNNMNENHLITGMQNYDVLNNYKIKSMMQRNYSIG